MTHYKYNGIIICGSLSTTEETEDLVSCDCLMCKAIIRRMHLEDYTPAHDEIEYPEESGFIFSTYESENSIERMII